MNGERAVGRPSSSELRHESHRRSVGRDDAGVEQVALLEHRVAPPQGPQLEAGAPLVAEQRVGRVAPREVAVLERGQEEVPGSRRAHPVGAEDPHPSLGRPTPERDPHLVERLQGLGGRGCRAARKSVQLGELLERRGGRDRGPELERLERDARSTGARPPGDRLPPGVRLLGEAASLRGERPAARRRRRAPRGARASAAGGAFQCLEDPVGSLHALAADPALEPVGDPLGFAPGRARM